MSHRRQSEKIKNLYQNYILQAVGNSSDDTIRIRTMIMTFTNDGFNIVVTELANKFFLVDSF